MTSASNRRKLSMLSTFPGVLSCHPDPSLLCFGKTINRDDEHTESIAYSNTSLLIRPITLGFCFQDQSYIGQQSYIQRTEEEKSPQKKHLKGSKMMKRLKYT
eukprot:TRINITY_DN16498_c0_g1_i1.p1 TRINITY_DN16498_c0_g1~~TRINITY_DN16498_c0_g1_i1.p1  ORF type:complete len:102 (-),score=7.63 TRINITY_DN16498_c0_g1_i1:116-421(-)